MSNIERLLGGLSKVKTTGKSDWIACCPAHADKSPSLTISEKSDGRILLHCFAGCSADEVMGAIGMELKDLMPENVGFHRVRPSRIPFNARDVLECLQNDAMLVGVFISDVTQGKPITPEEAANAMKAVARMIAATKMGGIQ